MAKVDSKGRIVLPKDLRERLGIVPGAEVEIREEDGKAVVEPEDDPDAIVDRMERLIAEASPNREATSVPTEELHPLARDHAGTIRRGARDADDDQ